MAAAKKEDPRVTIKMLRGMATVDNSMKKGATVEVSPAEAKRLVAKGWAENTSARAAKKEES